LIGVYDAALTEPIANTLGALGSRAAFVVHGADGLDELSTTGSNRLSHLNNGVVNTFSLDPADLGLPPASLADMVGGEPQENAQIMRDIISGADQGPRRDIVLLNAAAVLSVEHNDWQRGLDKARTAIDSGAAQDTLNAWIDKTNSFK
jgi:anthranilate phosphoribosyltransferase